MQTGCVRGPKPDKRDLAEHTFKSWRGWSKEIARFAVARCNDRQLCVHHKRSFLACLAVLCGVAEAVGQLTNHMTVEDLRHLRLPDVVLESATPVAPALRKNPHAAAYVKVKGVIGGNIRFELLLPDAWNGRFVMGGGGGFVGTVQNRREIRSIAVMRRSAPTPGTSGSPATWPVGRWTIWRRS